MNDKELLELAAKAAKRAGMNLLYGKSIDEQELQWHCDFAPWNPLTDDGDALRLAVQLGIRILHTCIESTTGDPNAVRAGTFIRGEAEEMYEDHDGDAMAATRRAITRAAAEIGRNM